MFIWKFLQIQEGPPAKRKNKKQASLSFDKSGKARMKVGKFKEKRF